MTSQYQERIKPSYVMDKIYQERLINLLLLPFNRQEAFRLGIIDAQGNQIKEPESASEKMAFTPFHQLAFGLKKFILKQPGGFNILRTSSFALNTLHKNVNRRIEPKDAMSIYEEFERVHKFVEENSINFPFEESLIENFILSEEGEGGSAGGSSEGSGEPVDGDLSPIANTTDNMEYLDYPLGYYPGMKVRRREVE